MAIWQDEGKYFSSLAPQLSQEWVNLHNQRLTASNFGVAVGHSRFTTPEEMVEIVSGRKEKSFSDYSQKLMDHGIKTEPLAREWYEQHYQVKVKEVGLAIPKNDYRIGASVDGSIDSEKVSCEELNSEKVSCEELNSTEGIIEIKCPKKRYQPIVAYQKARSQGWIPPPHYHQHIWDTHYDQMQGGMAITGKKWCDYIVYCTPENDVFVQRFPFDRLYWDNFLYPKINQWFATYREGKIPRIDPPS